MVSANASPPGKLKFVSTKIGNTRQRSRSSFRDPYDNYITVTLAPSPPRNVRRRLSTTFDLFYPAPKNRHIAKNATNVCRSMWLPPSGCSKAHVVAPAGIRSVSHHIACCERFEKSFLCSSNEEQRKLTFKALTIRPVVAPCGCSKGPRTPCGCSNGSIALLARWFVCLHFPTSSTHLIRTDDGNGNSR